ncbi:Phenylacetic acid catabolic protein [Halobellus ruber]|uniref:Phenylacetate-CoA oxygenase subunit PaaI n=1 Tax=Halobellus ruber TaxID=2761102 RepID=A0A7J9SMP5_9EURY|nr:Phenylacetic acid catabolic protein [Halobellus ruber]MBB6646361.1 phenylacetate-CoA oxygenase subunit PaaI [Halobellus ruber]
MSDADGWPDAAVDYVQAIADTKLLLGQRYGEWMLKGPNLEDDISGASNAQDEIGQVRQLFRLLKRQGVDDEWLESERDPAEYANAATLDTEAAAWPTFIVQAALTDRAAWLLLDAIDHDDFTGMVQKMGEDEYFHLEHHDGRLETLARDQPAAVEAALEEYFPQILGFVGPAAYDAESDPLVEAGFTDRPAAEIRRALTDHYEDLFAGTEVSVPPLDDGVPDPDEWDEQRRRVGDGHVDPDVVDQLQGVSNREYVIA